MKTKERLWHLIELAVVCIIVTAPHWFMANHVDGDEVRQTLAGGGLLAAAGVLRAAYRKLAGRPPEWMRDE